MIAGRELGDAERTRPERRASIGDADGIGRVLEQVLREAVDLGVVQLQVLDRIPEPA